MAGSPPLIEPENRPTDGQKTDLMVELVEKLTYADCKAIYDHYNFACLKEVAE